jgi:dTDP-4-dehydrorhamnose 3,5-epimerase-like enzyme
MKIKIYDLKKEKDCVFEDDRGWLISMINGDRPKGAAIKNVHLSSINPGQVRGNHYHKEYREWLLVAGESVIFSWRDEDGIGQKEIRSGDYFLFELEPGISHAIKNTGNTLAFLGAAANAVHDHSNPDAVIDKILI